MSLNETYKSYDTRKKINVFLLIFLFFCTTQAFSLPPDSITVRPKSPAVAAKSIYTIHFTISEQIPAAGLIAVTFPPQFDLSGVLIGGSTTINGGFELIKEDRKIILKRSGLGRTIEAGEKVDVKIANVINPPEARNDFQMKVEIRDSNNRMIIEKTDVLEIINPSES